MSFQLAPKAFWRAELISQFFCYLNSSKNITCPSDKLQTECTLAWYQKSLAPGYRTLLSLHTELGKSREVSQNFLVEGLTAEILGIGSPVSFKAGAVKMANMYGWKKCTLFVSVKVFSTESTYWGQYFFMSPTGDGTTFYVVIWATWRSSFLQCKGGTFSFSVFFEDPE